MAAAGWAALVLGLTACDDEAGDGGTGDAGLTGDADAGGGDAPPDEAADALADGTGDEPDAEPDGGGGQPSWETRAALAGGARQEHAVLAVEGEIWVLGGFQGLNVTSSVEIYAPEADEWRAGPALPGAMHHINAVVVGERIYLAGYLTGVLFEPEGRVFWREIGAEGDWVAGTDMPAGTERGASAVAVLGTRIYVAGGLTHNLATTDAFSAYDVEEETWESLPDLPSPRDHFPAAVFGERLCVAGGRDGGVLTGAVDCFEAGSWQARARLPTARAGTAGAVLDGLFYVVGGEGNDDHPRGVFPQVEAWDPVADAWTALPDMPTPRHGLGAAAVGRGIYLPGGGDQEAFGATAVHEVLVVPAR